MFGIAGQRERNEHSGVPPTLFRDKYIAPSTKVGKGVPIPFPRFALVTQCLVCSFSCCTEDTYLKMEQFLSRFIALVSDRRRIRDPQPVVGI